MSADAARATGDDTTASLIAFLRSRGAGEFRHARGQTLLDHLTETAAIVHRWGGPPWLTHAALLHSVYGTDVYSQPLFATSQRGEVADLAGPQAERLAYLFCVTPRRPLLAGTYRWAPGLGSTRTGASEPPPGKAPAPSESAPPAKAAAPSESAPHAEALRDGDAPPHGDGPAATREELDSLILLHMANLAQQACARDGSPGRWLVRLRDLAELLIDSDAVTLPLFIARLTGFSDAQETLTGRAYQAAVARGDEPRAAVDRLSLAAATCPVVAEPCVWLAALAGSRGDSAAARSWTQEAGRRLQSLGTAWDKRLTFDQWTELIARLSEGPLGVPPGALTDPRALHEAALAGPGVTRPHALPERAARSRVTGSHALPEREPARSPVHRRSNRAGIERFHRYVRSLGDLDGAVLGGIYPGLGSRPWHNPHDFPLALYLESHYPTIRDEILGLDSTSFQRESERIERSGDWDVAFFYERGRRHDEVCHACPVTTRAVEAHGAVKTLAGLSYVSRMRAGTHIAAHRGPTNLRLRCHLAIEVPEGDCAIRVDDETRRWRPGQCLVFDDHFEHEAWNHTGSDRLVLIVDLWHPDLSAEEIRLLEGLHAHIDAHAQRLTAYWLKNAAAGQREADA